MAWAIDFDDKARKQLAKIGGTNAERIVRYLEQRIAPLNDVRRQGSALQGPDFHHLWRYKVGDYRIICDIQDQKLVVLVIEIGHRSSVYR